MMEQTQENGMGMRTRRGFVVAGAAALAGLAWKARFGTRSVQAKVNLPKEVSIVAFTPQGQRQGVVTLPTVVKTDAEWRKQLGATAYTVTREEGTERAYTGPYWNLHDKGMYQCVCCGTALFSSETKFESGTGWPSFWAPIAKENVLQTSDSSFGMERTAVSCRRCDAHLGHVFDDGPQPTGMRYCMNSVSMKFVKFS